MSTHLTFFSLRSIQQQENFPEPGEYKAGPITRHGNHSSINVQMIQQTFSPESSLLSREREAHVDELVIHIECQGRAHAAACHAGHEFSILVRPVILA